jgi:hypothetical protein
MALHPHNRPPPLSVDSSLRTMSSSSADSKQPKTPANRITSFFGWKTVSSPGTESSSTEISDTGRSPLPSPLPSPYQNGSFAAKPPSTTLDMPSMSAIPIPVRMGSPSVGFLDPDLASKVSQLESELREISSELAGSIRREMELEDLVERLQLEAGSDANRRTSDYFSDSGIGSVRVVTENGGKIEDIEKIKRGSEQERALLRVELSQKWQEERSRRTASESHIQLLESQIQQVGARFLGHHVLPH